MRAIVSGLILIAVLAGCDIDEVGDEAGSPSASTSVAATSEVTTSQDTSPVTTSPVTTSPVELDLPAPVEGWATRTITIGDTDFVVAVADTPAKRSQGLMFIADLRDLEGMLFVWDAEREGTFWMKDTLIALDIVWFDGAGTVVGGTTMTPCAEDECRRYSPGVAYKYAVEAPQGELSFVDASTRLRVED